MCTHGNKQNNLYANVTGHRLIPAMPVFICIFLNADAGVSSARTTKSISSPRRAPKVRLKGIIFPCTKNP
jgi:hypothetical protein